MSHNLSSQQTMEKLATGQWRLNNLPSMRGSGYYGLWYAESLWWFQIRGERHDVSGMQRMDGGAALAFLNKCDRGGYAPALFEAWNPKEAPEYDAVMRALDVAGEALEQGQGPKSPSLRIMDDWWTWHTPWFGFVAVTEQEDKPPYLAQFDRDRVLGELLGQALRDPDQPNVPMPEVLAAARIDLDERALSIFASDGPTHQRAMWIDVRDGLYQGYLDTDRGEWVEVAVRAPESEEAALESCTRPPQAKVRSALFSAFKSKNLGRDGCSRLPHTMIERVNQALDVPTAERWLAQGEITVRCGPYRPDKWVSDSPTTMFNSAEGHCRPFAEVAREALGTGQWYQVRFERLQTLGDIARAGDDPANPYALVYTIPKAWARTFSRDKTVEKMLQAAWDAATGQTGPLARREETLPAEPYCAANRNVHLGDDTAGLRLHLVPIESGHGVHGHTTSIASHGLPQGVSIGGQSRLDMRSGGQINLRISAPQEVATRIKAACLKALP